MPEMRRYVVTTVCDSTLIEYWTIDVPDGYEVTTAMSLHDMLADGSPVKFVAVSDEAGEERNRRTTDVREVVRRDGD